MAQFEITTYGQNDEILKKFETDRVRWGVLMQAIELQDAMKDEDIAEQLTSINAFLKKIFPELTDEDLDYADADDVMNTFKQIITKANAIGGTRKNAKRAE